MDLETIKDDLLSVADSGLKYAQNKLPDAEIELYLSQNNSIIVEIQGGMVIARDALYSGTAVRVYNKRKKSFACTSGTSLENIRSTIDEAISISDSISYIDERFKSLYTPNGKNPSIEGIIDPNIQQLTSKSVGEEANKLVQDSKIDPRIISIYGSRQVSYGAFAISSSSGTNSASRYTINVGEVTAVAKEGNKQNSAFDFCVTRNVNDFDLSTTGLTASKKALNLLNSKSLNKSDILPVVWDSISASLYLKTALDAPISGKNVVEGSSYFADKIGDLIAVKSLEVVDDGQLPEAMTTNAIDGEGAPSQKTTIIDKGMLKSYLTDSYYGHLLDMETTANSKRIANPAYEGLPDISSNTLSVKPSSTQSFEKIIQNIDYGVYLTGFLLGIGHTNPVTGDMSAVSPTAFLIEKGEIKYPLEAINIAGNIYKSLKNIQTIGSDVNLTPFGVKTPSLVVDGFTVTG